MCGSCQFIAETGAEGAAAVCSGCCAARAMAAHSVRETGQALRRQGDGDRLDISRDFSCFLCNGHVVVQGCITLEPSFVRLSVATG